MAKTTKTTHSHAGLDVRAGQLQLEETPDERDAREAADRQPP